MDIYPGRHHHGPRRFMLVYFYARGPQLSKVLYSRGARVCSYALEYLYDYTIAC